EAITIQSWWRGGVGRRIATRRKHAAHTIRRFIKGFIYRHRPRCPENEYFLDYVRFSFLMKLKRNLPKTVLDKSWPVAPPALSETSELLRDLNMRNMVQIYCKRITPEWKQQLEQKVVASELFKDKKDNYPQSVPKLFVNSRIGTNEINNKVLQLIESDKIKYAVAVVKYDRNGYRPRVRQLLVTADSVFIVEEAKLKQRIEYTNLNGISVSSLSDGLFVLHVPCEDNKQKQELGAGNWPQWPGAGREHESGFLMLIKFRIKQGKDGIIDFTSGSELIISKAKSGHLSVVAPRLNSR
ncbi:hypothetical protein scyTo_0017893, partial [Scyliorhinus torazame]|nr:hypothetical protein [Scyliorhinus torazame]